MSYQEKKNITTMVTGAAVLAAYCLYAFGKSGPAATAPGDPRAWAITMLVFVGISIAATIAIQIIFHVLLSVSIAVRETMKGSKEIERAIKADMVDDERDKLIDRKFSWISIACGGGGFIAGLVALVLRYSPVVMINLIYIFFSAGSIIEGIAKLCYYRSSVHNG